MFLPGQLGHEAKLTLLFPATVPGSPRNITVTVVGDPTAVISFLVCLLPLFPTCSSSSKTQPPLFDGGLPILHYIATSPDDAALVGQAASSPVLVPNLQNGGSYRFTLRAINSLGGGSVPPPTPPVLPSALC